VTMVHPLVALRNRLGLTRRGFARFLGCSTAMIVHCEGGYTADIPPSLSKALQAKGFDVTRISKAHREFRESRTRKPDLERVWARIVSREAGNAFAPGSRR
jgi:DNA-binding XRE family transcriptional regulator